jgi:hypothetical protein
LPPTTVWPSRSYLRIKQGEGNQAAFNARLATLEIGCSQWKSG